jgi:hypothetical protein
MKKGIILIFGIILSSSALMAQSGPLESLETLSPLKEPVMLLRAEPAFDNG